VPAMGRVTVAKTTPGTAWGAMYWQYFEDLDKVTPAASPLALTRRLFVKRSTDGGAALDPLADGNTVKVGDRVTVRIELTVDRALDYVHLKDCRAAGFEPLEALSGCKWQDGLSYYESPRDLSTGFFFSHIGKGHYVFEYDVVAAHAGEFSEGFASVRCMYAPEFAAHSEGMRIQVKSEK